MEFGINFIPECLNGDIVVFDGFFVKIISEKQCNLISLKIFLSAVQLSIVLEQVNVKFHAVSLINFVNNFKYLIDQVTVSHFNRIQNKNLNLFKEWVAVLLQIYDEHAQEIEIYFSCYLLEDSLVYVVVLIGWLAFPSLKVLVKLVVIFKKQMEYFLNWIHDWLNEFVSCRYYIFGKCILSDKHTLQNVNHFNFQLRIRYLLVNRQENVQYVALLLRVSYIVEL